jgi:hypothetical protein
MNEEIKRDSTKCKHDIDRETIKSTWDQAQPTSLRCSDPIVYICPHCEYRWKDWQSC